MTQDHSHDLSRRRLLQVLAVAPGLLSPATMIELAACRQALDPVSLNPTPACGDDDDDTTPAQTEGPYFTPNSPARTSLRETGMAGTALVVTGSVLTRSCQPIAGALLDFWHADDSGSYDLVGYRLRGHQFTNADGVFRLETIVPGLY